MRNTTFFDMAVAALAQGSCPVYNGTHPEDVRSTFNTIFHGCDIDQAWLEIFTRKIFDESWGSHRVESITDMKDWPGLIVKGAAHYMKLVNVKTGRVEHFFHIGPYGIPIKTAQVTVETLTRCR